MQLKSHETVQLDSNLWPMDSTLWNMNYEEKKFSEKYPNQAWSVFLKNLTLALGTQCDRDPKSWVAGLLEQTGLTGTNCVSKKENGGFYTPSWPIYTYIGHSILWVFWEDGEKRKKEKKRKSDKNKIDLSSILFGRFYATFDSSFIWKLKNHNFLL